MTDLQNSLGIAREQIGVMIVDHGSRRAASNEMLLNVVAMFRARMGYALVEPAHMELAEPSIPTAFDRCVARGAKLVVVHPYFLLPGSHWERDIPSLTAEAARKHPEIPFLVTAPLGLHPLMMSIMNERIEHCLAHALDGAEDCGACADTDKCQIRST